MRQRGFTIVELLTIVVIISILASITIVGYGTWQRRLYTKTVKADLQQASIIVRSAHNFTNAYPTSFAAASISKDATPSFISSQDVEITLLHNATTAPVYSNGTPPLSENQNAQLFLDVCKENTFEQFQSYHSTCTTSLPDVSGAGVGFGGGSNTAWLASPIQNTFTISCTPPASGSCPGGPYTTKATATATAMKSQFLAQGGHFPVVVPQGFSGSALPTPTTAGSNASAFCLQGVSIKQTDLKFYISSTSPARVQTGTCPSF